MVGRDVIVTGTRWTKRRKKEGKEDENEREQKPRKLVGPWISSLVSKVPLSLSLSAIFGSAEGDEGENERGIQYLSDIMTICNHTYYFM